MEWFENEDFWRSFYGYMFSAERFAAAPDEVARILALTKCSGGNMLDLCCGPGRHSVEFAKSGFQVTGVDKSAFLLEKAREHASRAGASIEWVQEDMRNFVLKVLILPAACLPHSDTLLIQRKTYACCAIFIKVSKTTVY
jgi:SAM-dependent methyltransferase